MVIHKFSSFITRKASPMKRGLLVLFCCRLIGIYCRSFFGAASISGSAASTAITSVISCAAALAAAFAVRLTLVRAYGNISGSSMFLYRLTSSPFTIRQTGTASLSFAVIFPVFIIISTFRFCVWACALCESQLTHHGWKSKAFYKFQVNFSCNCSK